MTRYEIFMKKGARFSKTPTFTCDDPARVFHTLSSFLIGKYVERNESMRNTRIERRRCPYCDSFDEVIIYHKVSGNKDNTKIVFTVPGV